MTHKRSITGPNTYRYSLRGDIIARGSPRETAILMHCTRNGCRSFRLVQSIHNQKHTPAITMPNFTSLWLCLSYIVLSVATLSSLVHAKEEVVAQCPPHGCPFLPRDISFDKISRTALKRLRSGGASTETIDERKRLLQDLSTAGNDDSTVWTLIGYKGGAMKDQINQDRALILSPFQIFDSKDSTNQHDVAQLLGVFDGHGKLGEIVAQYTVTEIPIRLSNELRDIVSSHIDGTERDEKINKALIKVFNDIDQSIPTKGIGGCTASVVLRIGSKLYVVNAGDSVSFVALYTESTDEVNVVYVTREDKPHLPDEYQRITRMGGRVSQPDGNGGSSRVVFVDPNTGYVAGLAMSRSIGDWPATGVISEPIVQVLSIPELLERAAANPKTTSTTAATCAEDALGTCQDTMTGKVHIFAVSATDGLMDYLKPNEIARAFADSFYKRGKQTPHPHTVAEDLILKASEGWYEDMGGRYRDDITVAAARIYSSGTSNANTPEKKP